MTDQQYFELGKVLRQEIVDKKKIVLLKSIAGALISIALFLMTLVAKIALTKISGTMIIVCLAIVALFYAMAGICEYWDLIEDEKKGTKRIQMLKDLYSKKESFEKALVELDL